MPAPDPTLPDSVILSQFTGLKNTVTRERLTPTELERATNIDIDDAGQVHRRRGFSRKASQVFHSLFARAGQVLAVRDGDLGLVAPDYSFTLLQAGIGPDRLSYVNIAGDIYYSSATASGIVRADNSVEAWGELVSAGTWLSPVISPTPTLQPIRGRLLGLPPLATDIAYYKGRIYLASERTLWATELYLYNQVDKTKNFIQFEADITMLKAVEDGLYVGTEEAVYFLQGTFGQLKQTHIMDAGALRGSAIEVPAEEIRPVVRMDNPHPLGTAIMYLTNRGLCVGFDNGAVFNITQDKFWFPDAETVAPLYQRSDGGSRYIGVADSAGGPASNTRIGDYLDAEIIRFQGV